AAHLLAQNAGRNVAQDGLLAADDERVPGVVPALEARDCSGALGEQIDDLALAFIAPLRADDDDELTHVFPIDLSTLASSNEEQDRDAHEHAAETRDPQLPVADGHELLERAFEPTRIQERHYTFEHEEQGERGEQIVKVKRHVKPAWRTSAR